MTKCDVAFCEADAEVEIDTFIDEVGITFTNNYCQACYQKQCAECLKISSFLLLAGMLFLWVVLIFKGS